MTDLPCPHGRPHWSGCPHCLGLNQRVNSIQSGAVCSHGQLARQCPICGLETENETLRDDLARVTEERDILRDAVRWAAGDAYRRFHRRDRDGVGQFLDQCYKEELFRRAGMEEEWK
jgi:hypothetical protein